MLVTLNLYLCTPKMSITEINSIVGKRIKDFRKLRGYSQAQVSDLTNINRATISQLESGKQQITLTLVYALAKGLGVEITTFLPLLKHLEVDSLTEKIEQQNINEATKNSILQLLNKKPDNDK